MLLLKWLSPAEFKPEDKQIIRCHVAAWLALALKILTHHMSFCCPAADKPEEMSITNVFHCQASLEPEIELT